MQLPLDNEFNHILLKMLLIPLYVYGFLYKWGNAANWTESQMLLCIIQLE